MTTSNETQTIKARPRTWKRKLAIASGALLVLLVVAYFVGTSSMVVRGLILPKVGQALNAQVSASQASVSPFSQVQLKDFTIKTTGNDPLLSAAEVRLRYSLWSIIKGNLAVQEVLIDSPAIRLVVNEDGSSNLDPILKSGGPPAAKPPPANDKPSAMTLDIGSVLIKNASVRLLTHTPGGGKDSVDVTNVHLTLKDLRSGQKGTLELTGGVYLDTHKAGAISNDFAQVGLGASFTLGMGPGVMPTELKGRALASVDKAGGARAGLAGFGIQLESDVSPTEVKELSLRFTKSGTDLGALRVAGNLNVEKQEGVLTAEIRSIDRKVLNTLGGASGLDFGGTKIDSTNRVELARGGNLVSVIGRLAVAEAGIVAQGTATPILDLAVDYELALDQTAQLLQLRALRLSGAQNRKPILTGLLDHPMQLALGPNASAAEDARLHVAIDGLNLEDWKAFLKDMDPKGTLQMALDVESKNAGKQLAVSLTSSLQSLSARLATSEIREARIELALGLDSPDMNAFNLSRCQLTWNQASNVALKVDAGGSYNLSQGQGLVHVNLADLNAFALRPLLQPSLGGRELVSASVSGTNAIGLGQGGQIHVQSHLKLANLVMKDPTKDRPDPPLDGALLLRASATGPKLDLSEARLSLAATPRAENVLTVRGTVDATDPNAIRGQINVASSGLDLTSYYNAFASQQPAPAQTEPPPPPETVSSVKLPGKEKEPDPIILPLKDFVLGVDLAKLFLREVEIKEFKLKALVDGGHILADPFAFRMNDQPVSLRSDLDLSVPGWRYDIVWTADHVPLVPLVNSFAERNRDKIKGAVVLDARLKGAGITGPSLQKNHQGQLSLSVTNADISVLGKNLRWLVYTVAVPLRLHELTTSPLNWMALQLNLGQGKIVIPALDVQAQAYAVNMATEIPIDAVLTNSPLNNIPVHFLLSRNVAEKSGLMPKDAAPEAPYVPLPDFVHVRGTLGATQVDVDKLVLTKLAAVSTLAIKDLVGDKAGDALDALHLKDAVSGGTTNTLKALDKLGGFLKLKKDSPTNAPAKPK